MAEPTAPSGTKADRSTDGRETTANETVRAVTFGDDPQIDPNVIVAPPDGEGGPTRIGDRVRIRSGSVVYGDVRIGDDVTTGHDVVVRAGSRIGNEVLLGTKTVIDGDTTVGDRTSLQTGVYVPPASTIGPDVFVGPNVVMTNDPYPVRRDVELCGPTIEDHVSIGANATLLPDVTIGRGAFVAAGAVVDADVPPETLAVGVPATTRSLPPDLVGENDLP